MPNSASETPAGREAEERGLLPWGLKDIADFTGKEHNTVRQWPLYKSSKNPERDWPPEDYIVAGDKAWAERTVLFHLYTYGVTTREPLPANVRRRVRAKLLRWGMLDS